MSFATLVEASDEAFKQVGGSTRHWVRECLLPLAPEHGVTFVPDDVAVITRAVREADRHLTALGANTQPGEYVPTLRRFVEESGVVITETP